MNLNLNKIKYDDFMSSIKDQKIYEVKKKRERAVYFVPDMKIFYKVWVRDWTQSEITSFGVASGFYNEENASSLISLLYDDSGPRGYVQHAGESAVGRGKSDKCWDYFVSKTSRNQRLLFMKNILSSSILARGTYTDLAPCNIIFYNDKINFIDFESFRSFSLLFESKKEKYGPFKTFEDAKNLTDLGGVVYAGNPTILKKICPGEYGTIRPIGYCMIGKR